MSAILEILVAFPLSVAAWMSIEYFAHRWPMHHALIGRWFSDAWHGHAYVHHRLFFRVFDAETHPAAPHVSMTVDPLLNAVGSAVFWVPLGLWVSWPAAIVFVIVALGHGCLWSLIHREMHFPKRPWWSRTRVYRYIRRHHEVHHQHPGSNFCALFPPFCDWIFGTWRR